MSVHQLEKGRLLLVDELPADDALLEVDVERARVGAVLGDGWYAGRMGPIRWEETFPRRGFYGPGWCGYGWGWGGGQEIRTDTLVGVETLLYDLAADKLVWAGQSETMNPSKAESFMRELVRAVGNELQKDGLVGPAK